MVRNDPQSNKTIIAVLLLVSTFWC
uniref:Uncharacterized protein n=1 Tax=Arundo donax TaxID=35708 RepID=A0A0A9A272_ARUDO